MLNINLSPQALIDLEEIFNYTAKNWSLEHANKYQDSIFSRMQEIAMEPSKGKLYPFSQNEYHYLKVNRHLLFYSFNQVDCLIIRILHEKMDINFHIK